MFHVLSLDFVTWCRHSTCPQCQSLPACGLAYSFQQWAGITFVIELILKRASLRVTFAWSAIPQPPSSNQPDSSVGLEHPRLPLSLGILVISSPLVSCIRLCAWKASPQTHTKVFSFHLENTQTFRKVKRIVYCHMRITLILTIVSSFTYLLQIPYVAMYNEHFFAQIFEGKIRVHIIHGYIMVHAMGIIMPRMMHTKTWVLVIHSKIRYFFVVEIVDVNYKYHTATRRISVYVSFLTFSYLITILLFHVITLMIMPYITKHLVWL